ncbi:hypothetical protein [uncultured Bacteroides sp.]|nr:hypothetical protein [uncultured Bacteroides sp.]
MKQKWIMLACIATTLASWAGNESNGTLEEQKRHQSHRKILWRR